MSDVADEVEDGEGTGDDEVVDGEPDVEGRGDDDVVDEGVDVEDDVETGDDEVDADDLDPEDEDDEDPEDEDADEVGAGSGALAAPTAVAVLEYLAKALVTHPDEVRVEVDESDGVTLNVYVADGDMGQVIGKRGRVANAVRSVTRAAAAKDGQSGVSIEFLD